ncbi:MAG: PAS domain S-box protein [Sphingobacteriaceae bacterium]|nr:PAS domain S-box protein [Sphingobacteriaceae bacterium]
MIRTLGEILSSVSDAVWSFDLASNKFVYINSRLADLYETSLDNIEETDSFWLPYIHHDDYNYAVTEAEQVYSGKKVEIEYRILVKGKVKWVLDKRSVLFDENNNPQIITGILSDITVRKTDESKLTDLEKTFRYIFLNNPNPLWIYDLESLKFLEVNNAAIAKYGYTRDEFLSMTIADIRPKEDVPELLKHVKNVGNQYLNSQKYWRHAKKNGDVLYVNISGHGINHKGRNAEIVMAHDITLEVEGRITIELGKENLDALINSIKEHIWSIDTKYKFISLNKSLKESIKQSVGREIKIGDSVLLPEYEQDEIAYWKNYYDRALKGETFSFIEMVKLPSKLPLCAEITMSPIKNKGRIIGAACISYDIQEKLNAQELIIEQNKKLREVISLASHEIRGPVASLMGLISAFNRDDLTDPNNEEVIRLITDVTTTLDAALHKLVDKSYSLREERKPKHAVQYNRSGNE